MSTLLERAPAELATEDNVFTHIINCPESKHSAEAWLTEARVMGLQVEALCGHVWVPARDPEKHPVCAACVDAAGIIAVEEFGL